MAASTGCSDPRAILPLMAILVLLMVMPFIFNPRRPRTSFYAERNSDELGDALDKAAKPSRWPWEELCQREVENGEYGYVDWPKTEPKRTRDLPCPYGGIEGVSHPKARRKCEWSLQHSAEWQPSNYTQCRKKFHWTPEEAQEAAEELEKQTADPAQILPETFTNATDTLNKIFPFALKEKKVAQSMFGAVSNLLDTDRAVLQEGDADGYRSRRVLQLLHLYTATVPLQEDERHRLSFKNLDMHVHVQRAGNHTGHDFQPDFSVNDQVPSLFVPAEASRQAAGVDAVPVRVRFLALRNARFLRPPGQRSDDQVIVSASFSRAKSNRTTRSADYSVSSKTVEDEAGDGDSDVEEGEVAEDLEESIKGLTDAVLIKMPWSAPGTAHICSYYDVKNETWSSDGVLTKFKPTGVVCESSHLTAFCLLLDPFPRRDLGDLRVPLDILTYVGASISTVGLGLTVVTYYFSRLGRDRWGRVLVQLCLALFLLHVSFMMTGFKGLLPPEVCAGVAITTHLMLLVTLAWMLVEALLLYQLLITVFQGAENSYMLKRGLLAWGVPVILVGGTAAYDFRYYGDTHPDFCMVSGAMQGLHYGVFMSPAAGVLMANVVIFVLVSRVLLRRRQPPGQRVGPGASGPGSAQPQKVTCAQVRGVVGVAFLLGVTWVLSPLAGGNGVMQVISTVTNCTQGAVIFMSRVLFHPEARRVWRGFLCSEPKEPRMRTRPGSSGFRVEKGGLWSRLQWTTPTSPVANQTSDSSDKKSWWALLQRRQSSPMQTSSTAETSTEPQQLKVNI